ncbi:MAG: hypothetical protein JWM36_2499 [Hyphomicrobiales bacterium]|nr:hypothetical protein [Hyphomicrobiales bacterium]
MSASTFADLQALAGLRYRIARLGLARAQKALCEVDATYQTLDRESVAVHSRLNEPLVFDGSHKPMEARGVIRRRLQNLQTRVDEQKAEAASHKEECETALHRAAALSVRREVKYSEFQELSRKDCREAERAAERRRDTNGA